MKSQIQKKKKEGGIVELLIPTFFQKKYGVDLNWRTNDKIKVWEEFYR